jgi:hypothetical protein
MNPSEVVTDVAKELFVRRLFNIKHMPDYEIEAAARDCIRKAALFVKANIQAAGPGNSHPEVDRILKNLEQ